MNHISAVRYVADYVRAGARELPEKAAIILDDASVAFSELHERSSRIANGIGDLGAKPGDHICYIGRNTPALLEVLFGVLKVRAVFAPLNWRLAAPELREIIEDNRPKAIFIEMEFHDSITASWPEFIAFTNIIIVDAPSDGFAMWRDCQSGSDPIGEHRDDDVALQIYTSGTTGKPKGIRLTNANIYGWRQSEDQLGGWMRYRAADVIVAAAPFFHVGGLGWALSGLSRRASCVLMQGFNSHRMLELIERHRITHAFAVPAVIDDLCLVQDQARRDVTSLRLLHYGSASIAPTILRKAIDTFGCGFVQHYGMTEASGIVIMPPDLHITDNFEQLKTCGVVAPDVEIRVVDEHGHDAGINMPAELWFKAAMVAESFWQDGQVKPMPLREGWYQTGDIGMQNAEGFITLLDRKKDMIISGGENIYPVEVERVLCAHPAVAECAVIGVPDQKWGEAVKALIIPRSAAEISFDEIIAFARARIAGYKLPKTVEIRDEFPRTPAGKVQKNILREPYWINCDRRIN